MNNILIACALKVVIGVSPGVAPMNEFDYEQLKTASKRCVLHFPNSPCVAKFVKTGDREYQVTCGKDNAND